MVMIANSLPGLKGVLEKSGLHSSAATMATRMIAAFTLHPGRMSCLRAAASVRSDGGHRAQVGRFLAKRSSRLASSGDWLRKELLRHETTSGAYVLVIDATLCSQAGKLTENTCSTGNRKSRTRKKQRYGAYRYHRRSCHAFTFGILITPSGRRIPMAKSYDTMSYCKTHGIKHRTTAESAADMVRELKVPAGVRRYGL